MIKPLRKRHLQLWLGLAFLLPASILAGWLAVPAPATDTLLQPATPAPLPLRLASHDSPAQTITLRASADTATLQLEWVTKSELAAPSALIYAGERLLGRIGPQGVYRFSFTPGGKDIHPSFTVYDIIHHKNIEKINF